MFFIAAAVILCVRLTVVDGLSPPGPPASSPGNAGVCATEGAEFSNQNFWYRCLRDPKTKELTAEVQGCVYQNDHGLSLTRAKSGDFRVGDGGTFHYRDMVIKCLHDQPTNTWSQEPVGCLGRSASADATRPEHKIGEEWDEGEGVSGNPSIKYKMVCERKGFTTLRKATHCVYTGSGGGGGGQIEGGCMKKFGDNLVQCIKREGKGQFLRAQIVYAPDQKVEADAQGTCTGFVTTTPTCPMRCPDGWNRIPDTGTDHCYLLPEAPIMQAPFWQWQNYCASKQPTAYIVEPSTQNEFGAVGFTALNYLGEYLATSYYMWIGAYYENGTFHWLNGDPWNWNAVVMNPLSPPANGSCVEFDPRKTTIAWDYQSCDNPNGATICEMAPLPDCSGTTRAVITSAPYAPPACERPKMSDFAQQQQRGYLGVSEMITLTGMDAVSCGVACMFYSQCYSFDISTAGDCRLLNNNNLFTCGSAFVADENYAHYDRISM